MDEDDKIFIAKLLAYLFIFVVATMIIVAVIVPLTLFNGWVLVKLWAWFIVPIFHVPALPLLYAIGITLTVRTLTTTLPSVSDEKKAAWPSLAASILVGPLITLGFGYMIHWLAIR